MTAAKPPAKPPANPPARPPRDIAEFRARLEVLSGNLPRRLQQCADHLETHPERIALSTVAELAAGAGVPPSALIRFCQHLGFSGFSGLQRLYRDSHAPRLPDYAERLENLRARGAGRAPAILAEFVEAGRLSLEHLARDLETDAFEQATQMLAGARLVHVAGMRRAFPVATYLAYTLEKMQVPSLLHAAPGKVESRHAMGAGDVLVVISYAPWSQESLELATTARDRDVPVVFLTDTPTAALRRLASLVLCVTEADFGAFRGLSASMALAIALAVSVGAARPGADGK